MFIDSHAHFDTCIIDAHIAEETLFEHMAAAKVTTAVHIATEVASFRWTRDFARRRPVYFALGIHPSTQIRDTDIDDLSAEVRDIRAGAESGRLVAIGEAGLDYYHQVLSVDVQRDLFERQIEIARANDLAVIVHSRDAFEDTYAILRNARYQRIVLHCFSGDAGHAEKYLSLGCVISFAGNLTFKKAENLRAALSVIPSSSLLFETDCPYLSPEPHRGSRNEPANVSHIYTYAADHRNEPVKDLAAAVAANFERVFGVKPFPENDLK